MQSGGSSRTGGGIGLQSKGHAHVFVRIGLQSRSVSRLSERIGSQSRSQASAYERIGPHSRGHDRRIARIALQSRSLRGALERDGACSGTASGFPWGGLSPNTDSPVQVQSSGGSRESGMGCMHPLETSGIRDEGQIRTSTGGRYSLVGGFRGVDASASTQRSPTRVDGPTQVLTPAQAALIGAYCYWFEYPNRPCPAPRSSGWTPSCWTVNCSRISSNRSEPPV